MRLQTNKIIPLFVAAALLAGCEGKHSRADNAMGGVLVGGATGGAVGLVCCGNPVVGLPAGILIGGVVGGVGGLIMPAEH